MTRFQRTPGAGPLVQPLRFGPLAVKACGLAILAGLAGTVGAWPQADEARARALDSVDGETETAIAASTYPVVAKLAVDLPAQNRFTLRGTIPVPKNSFPRADGLLPFAVVGPDGQGYAAQIEIVSRYPKLADGADVVEILARVRKPLNQSTGRAEYDVVRYLHPNRGLRVTETISALLNTPGSLRFESRDVFDNPYSLAFLDNADGEKQMRSGRAAATYRLYGTLRPTGPNIGPPAGALSHFMGVHAYVTAWAEEDVLSIDLRVSNGASGADPSPLNDPQADLYFKSLDLRVPAGWVVLQLFDDPHFGPTQNQGNSSVGSIVNALPGGKMHVLPQHHQFHRRLVVTPAWNVARAQSIVSSQGLAFCVDDYNAAGERLWSWWNPATARYFPTNTRLPKIDWIPSSTLNGFINNQLNEFTDIVANGLDPNAYPVYSGTLGWAHPFGTPYGGMTGATEIVPVDGIKTAFTGNANGYRLTQLVHRMYTDRQPMAFYNLDGNPSLVEDWVKNNPVPHLPMSYFQVLGGGGSVPGWSSAPSYQVDYVIAQGLDPDYQAELLNYDTIDQQHYIRYTRSPKVLTWLGNDPLAKDDIELSAESMRLRFCQYPVTSPTYISSASMLHQQNFVAANPGIGFAFGRGQAWSVDTVTTAYAIGTTTFRNRSRPWLDDVLDLLESGQSACSGIVQRISSNALLNGAYNVRQSYEETLTELAVLGLHEVVYADAYPAKAARADAILRKSLDGLLEGSSWNVQVAAPHYTMAVDDLTTIGPGFCGFLPPNGTSAVDKTHSFASLEVAHRLTGDNSYVVKTAQMMGAANATPSAALAVFYQTYFTALEVRAPMIAALQLLLE